MFCVRFVRWYFLSGSLQEDFKRRRCIFAMTLLSHLVIGEAQCSNKLEKKFHLLEEFLCEVWVKLKESEFLEKKM